MIRRAGTAVLTALLALSAAGAAAAQNGSALETRADFVYRLEVLLGIAPLYPTFPDFSDVSPSNPYYGYVEAAYRYGIAGEVAPGVFGADLPVTRAEAARSEVVAFGAGQAAQSITSTKFSDNAQIPPGLVGYVGEAAALGLMQGFRDGSFGPNSDLTVSQETALLARLKAVIASAKPTLQASSSDVAVGQRVTLAMTAAIPFAGAVSYAVTGTNQQSAVLDGNVFAATAPGTYTVQGTVGGVSATTAITVYGPPIALRITAPTSVVENGVSTSRVSVTVVDQNGNPVADSTDTIALYANSNAAACVLNVQATCAPAGGNAPAEAVPANGVATFTLKSGMVAGTTAGLTAEDVTNTHISTGTASVSGQAQVPTALQVTAEGPYLTVNSAGYTDTFDVQAMDQTGNPMLIGTYPFTSSLSGPATFLGGSTSPQTGVYVGDGLPGISAPSARVTVQDVQGETGTVTLTAAATGMTSGTATVTSVITGAPSQIVLSAAQSTNADTPAAYTATIEDSHGYPTDWTGSVSLAGNAPGVQFSPSATLQFDGTDTASFTALDYTAGKYTLTASDLRGSLASATQSLTVAAGPPATATITPTTPTCSSQVTCTISSYVLLSNPTWTETVQLYDDHGNPAPDAGVLVDFTLTPAGPPLLPTYPNGIESNYGLGTINGVTAATAVSSVTVAALTNAQGTATATVSALAFNLDDYQVSARIPLTGTTLQGAYVQLTDLAANAPINVAYTGPGNTPAYTLAADGTTYTGAFVVQNLQGIGSVTQDIVRITQSGTGNVQLLQGAGGTLTQNPDGSYTLVTALTANGAYGGSFDIQALKAGSVTLTYQDLNQLSMQPATSTLSVVPGIDTEQIGFSSGGTAVTASTPLTVAAGAQVPITVTAEDAGGNPIPNLGNIAVQLSVTGGAGEIRATSTGADLGSPAVIHLPPGQGSVTFYYLNDTSGSEQINFAGSTALVSQGSFQPVAAGGTAQLGFRVVRGSGQPVANASVAAAVASGAGSVQLSNTADSTGDVSIPFTAPQNGWQSGSSAVVQATYGSLSVDVTVTGE